VPFRKEVIDDETLASSIKQSTQPRRKGRINRGDPSLSHKSKTQNGSQRGKGINYVPKPPLVARSIVQREGKPKKTIVLEEPSLIIMIDLKIKMTCVLYKLIINTLYI
jgi:hypothetical protein